jgi:hypothetical protein
MSRKHKPFWFEGTMELDRLLSSLVGMDVEEARSIIRANSFDAIVFQDRSPMAAVAYHNTIILFESDGRVTTAYHNTIILFESDGRVTTAMVGDPAMSNKGA